MPAFYNSSILGCNFNTMRTFLTLFFIAGFVAWVVLKMYKQDKRSQYNDPNDPFNDI